MISRNAAVAAGSVRANWIERFKDRHAPRWLRKLWPIRWVEVTRWRPVSTQFGKSTITLKLATTADRGRKRIYLGYDADYDVLAVRVTEGDII